MIREGPGFSLLFRLLMKAPIASASWRTERASSSPASAHPVARINVPADDRRTGQDHRCQVHPGFEMLEERLGHTVDAVSTVSYVPMLQI